MRPEEKRKPRRETKLPGELELMRKRLRKANALLVASEVSKSYGIDVSELSQKSRKRRIVEARQVAMFFQSFRKTLTLDQIGSLYEKDHLAVLHSRGTVENLCETNAEFRDRILKISQSIMQNNKKL